jgi:hypothetical protein
MDSYRNFSLEEFIQDAYFRQWALDELSVDDTFWENWIQLNPEKLKMIEEAKSLVIALKVKPIDVFTASEIVKPVTGWSDKKILPNTGGILSSPPQEFTDLMNGKLETRSVA